MVQTELDNLKTEGFFIGRIKPLAIVNIDSLIFHQIGLSESIALHQVIQKYTEHTKILTHLKFRNQKECNDYILSKQIAFSTFINEYFHNEGLTKKPPVLEMIAPAIFKYDQLELSQK